MLDACLNSRYENGESRVNAAFQFEAVSEAGIVQSARQQQELVGSNLPSIDLRLTCNMGRSMISATLSGEDCNNIHLKTTNSTGQRQA